MTSRILKTGLGAVSLAAISMSGNAHAAVSISGGITGLSLPGDPGLALTGTALAFGDFTLANVGDVHDAAVLQIGTAEGSINVPEDMAPRNVAATFTFASPVGAGGVAAGSSSGFYRLFTTCGIIFGGCGRVTWTNPTIFTFGNGGSFSVRLSDVEFRTPGSATVNARFELLANSVPEPQTWALLILGFGAVGAAMRSRRGTTRVTYA